MSSMLNFNGKLIPDNTAFLDHKNRGITYGDSLFETLRAANGVIFFLEEHYLRLMASMRILRMEIPMNFTMEYMEEQIVACLKSNRLLNKPSRVRLTVFRDSKGLYLPENNDIAFYISCATLRSPFYILETAAYEVELFKDFYINPDMLSNLKTNNRIINVVGSIYANENGYDNCLLLNQDKQVVEALNANIFLVKGKTIKTPPLKDGCINGIIRKRLIEIVAKSDNYELEEVSISPFELQKADELFVTNTVMGIKPITKYRKAEYSSEVAGALLKKLNTRVKEVAS